MSPHVLAFDLALANSGAATITNTGRVDTWLKTTPPLPKSAPVADVDARISEVHAWTKTLLTTSTQLVVIEGPSLHSKHGQPHERAGLYWRVVHTLRINHIPFGVVAPKRMKWFITGSGNADKDQVRAAVATLWPDSYLRRASYDECDAVGLAAMGVCKLAAVHGPSGPWKGPWLDARALAIDTNAQWPEIGADPAPPDPREAAS